MTDLSGKIVDNMVKGKDPLKDVDKKMGTIPDISKNL